MVQLLLKQAPLFPSAPLELKLSFFCLLNCFPLKTLKPLLEIDPKRRLSPEKSRAKNCISSVALAFLPVLLLSVLYSVVAWSYYTATFDLGKY